MPSLFDLAIDGSVHGASWAVITNVGRYGGRFMLTKEGSIFEKGLVAVLFKATTRSERCSELLALATGRAHLRSSIEFHKCRHVRVLAPEGLPVQVDGDSAGQSPLEVSAGGPAIALIVPSLVR